MGNELRNDDVLSSGIFALILLTAACYACGKKYVGDYSAKRFPKWIAAWLLISSMICVWDALFVFNRPASFKNVIWAPYRDYVVVDKLYGDTTDDFVFCQSVMNLVEVFLNICALNLVSNKRERYASVFALVASAMTCAKTVLYFLMEISSDFSHTGHNTRTTFYSLFVLPNGIWILVPFLCCIVLGRSLAENVDVDASGEKLETPPSTAITRSAKKKKKKKATSKTRHGRSLSSSRRPRR